MTDHPRRAEIESFVADNPGVHFSELRRRLELATGQVQYHLRRLCRADRLHREEHYGRTHYYPPECQQWERAALATLRRETARDVVVYLVETGPSAPATVADDLDIARSTLEFHLDRLTDHDLVAKRRDDAGTVTLAVPAPDDTVAVLREVDPTVADRLVDRFTRLLDALLAE
jgi:predicted transcriptional regulator